MSKRWMQRPPGSSRRDWGVDDQWRRANRIGTEQVLKGIGQEGGQDLLPEPVFRGILAGAAQTFGNISRYAARRWRRETLSPHFARCLP